MGMGKPIATVPVISYTTGKFWHDEGKCAVRVRPRDRMIRVGCSYITFEAVKALGKLTEEQDEIVVQE